MSNLFSSSKLLFLYAELQSVLVAYFWCSTFCNLLHYIQMLENSFLTELHCFQTFSQLCVFNYETKTVEVYKAPWYIQDEPRFVFRGLLLGKKMLRIRQVNFYFFGYHFLFFSFLMFQKLKVHDSPFWVYLYSFTDTSRHYLPVSVIKQVIDSMSYAKMVRSIPFVKSEWSIPPFFSLHSFLSFLPHISQLFSIYWYCERHSVECSPLAHHRWTILSFGDTFLSGFVERFIHKVGEIYCWGCIWSCWVRHLSSSSHYSQYGGLCSFGVLYFKCSHCVLLTWLSA